MKERKTNYLIVHYSSFPAPQQKHRYFKSLSRYGRHLLKFGTKSRALDEKATRSGISHVQKETTDFVNFCHLTNMSIETATRYNIFLKFVIRLSNELSIKSIQPDQINPAWVGQSTKWAKHFTSATLQWFLNSLTRTPYNLKLLIDWLIRDRQFTKKWKAKDNIHLRSDKASHSGLKS